MFAVDHATPPNPLELFLISLTSPSSHPHGVLLSLWRGTLWHPGLRGTPVGAHGCFVVGCSRGLRRSPRLRFPPSLIPVCGLCVPGRDKRRCRLSRVPAHRFSRPRSCGTSTLSHFEGSVRRGLRSCTSLLPGNMPRSPAPLRVGSAVDALALSRARKKTPDLDPQSPSLDACR